MRFKRSPAKRRAQPARAFPRAILPTSRVWRRIAALVAAHRSVGPRHRLSARGRRIPGAVRCLGSRQNCACPRHCRRSRRARGGRQQSNLRAPARIPRSASSGTYRSVPAQLEERSGDHWTRRITSPEQPSLRSNGPTRPPGSCRTTASKWSCAIRRFRVEVFDSRPPDRCLLRCWLESNTLRCFQTDVPAPGDRGGT